MNSRNLPSTISKNGLAISTTMNRTNNDSGTFNIHGEEYGIFIENGKRFLLNDSKGETIAHARYFRHYFKRILEVEVSGESYVLKQKFHSRTYRLFNIAGMIGEVRPDGIWSENVKVVLKIEVPDMLAVFLGYVVLGFWDQDVAYA